LVRISFVCSGNICRSPTAEAVMRRLVREAGLEDKVHIDSAGTGAWHVGEQRDRRSREVAERRGAPLSGRARQFTARDFARFDYVLAMDGDNLADLCDLAPDAEARAKVRLLRSFDPAVAGRDPDRAGGGGRDAGADADVPDPYYGGPDGFERVFDICTAACRSLLAEIRRAHGI
jgi:protein-tyrosine phosphatase